VAETFTYLGAGEMWYQDYRDEATGKMLKAEPLQAYTISSVDPVKYAVPPNDGRWEAADTPPPAPAPPAAPAAQPASAPAAPASEGGEED
jgi:hypothetical protein